MVRWKERLARSPGGAALTRAADLAGRTPREMPRVRCAYPGYRLAGRSPRGKPRVRCAYLGHRLAGRTPREMPRVRYAYPGYRLAGRTPREMPRVRCAYPGYRLAGRAPRESPGCVGLTRATDWLEELLARSPGCAALTRATDWPEEVLAKSPGCAVLIRATDWLEELLAKAPGALCLPGVHASMDCAARPGQARIPALAPLHAWASDPQNRTRPGKTRALFVSDKRNKKNRPAARHCATPDDLTSLLASCLPPASCPYGFLVCRPPGDPQSLWRGIHCCRPGIQCLNASPPVEQLGSLPLSWQGPLRPSPRSGRDSVRPSSIRFPSPAPTPRRS